MRQVSVALTVVLLAALVPAAASGFSQQSVDADVVVMTADVAASGDATWTIDYRTRLSDDNETQAFEELQAEIRTNESIYTNRFRERLTRTARAGVNATGREMTIDNVSVRSSRESVGQSYGVVSYEFRWTNFATSNDTHLRVGDAINGLYLDQTTSLTVQWPAEYQRARVRPSPDEATARSVTWQGRQSFADDEPLAVAETNPPSRDADGQFSALPVIFAVLLVLVGGYGVYRFRRTNGEGDGADESPADGATGTDPSAGDGDDGVETPSEDLLSNEEQVVQFLRESGGRVKQQRVASELDWTAAKTSQVIGGLREDGELETFRIGRENVVTLPETDVIDDSERSTDDDI